MATRPLDSLIDGIYEAALDPARWTDILGDIREIIGASAYSLFTLASDEGQKPELITCNIDPNWSKEYREYWWQHDEWVQGAIGKGLAGPGMTMSGSMLVESKAFNKGIWFNEALKQQDIGDLLTTTLWSQEKPGPQLVLSFYRSPRDEHFGSSEIDHLSMLSGHLRRAFQLTLMGSQLSESMQQQTAVLDGISQPILILDSQRKITSLNLAAEHLLSTPHEGIVHVRSNRVIALGERATPPFETAFEIARMEAGKPVQIAFVIPANERLSATGCARLMKLRQPPTQNFRLADQERYMLQIELTDMPPPDSLRAFGELFSLTQAEFRVLVMMIEDYSPRMIAERLGISLPTVRTHLQRIRQKTGSRRFADLIRLALAASKSH